MVTDLDYRAEPAVQASRPVGRSMLSRVRLGHVVMVLAALFALVLNLAVLQGNEATVEIAVAATDIKAGTTLTSVHLESAIVPADDVVTSRFLPATAIESVSGKLALRPIAAGEPILDSDLLVVENRTGLRAMSIPIEQSRAVSGALTRGDVVDVILVENGIATYIATGVEIVDVPGADANVLGTSAGYAPTVAIDSTQALRIAAALDAGDVHIIRSTGARTPDLDQAPAIGEVSEGDPG